MVAVNEGVVAVTGASGFIGSHICKALLENGFSVRAVVRDKDNQEKTAHLRKLADDCSRSDAISFYSGDLLIENSYDEAFLGCDAVVHSAAVVEIGTTSNPQRDIVDPSVLGTQNVLKSLAKASSIKRLVFTSSVAAVHSPIGKRDGYMFTEADYNEYSTIANDAYGYAKREAEFEAMGIKNDSKDGNKDERKFDAVSINPGVVLGPCLTKQHTKSSAVLIRQIIYGNKMDNYRCSFVDVRDVALAHVRALTLPEATGSRFIAVCDAPPMTTCDLAPIAQSLFPQYALTAVPSVGWMGWVAAKWLGYVGEFQIAMVERTLPFSNEKARTVLGVQFRPLEETVRDTVTSMIDSGWIKPRRR
eukprot:c3570_g1_i1.p1 GENE.c3570_g1_i1~~c3570_g1_i1.p1  ORF type:complete len:372 (-),score=109.96 c3570_g1_i1:134-1213(-)